MNRPPRRDDRRDRAPKRLGQKPPVAGGPCRRPGAEPRQRTDWDHVASWYDRLVGEDGSDYHRNVILPAALRMLEPKAGEKMLDLCCGQGVLSRLLDEKGVHVLGLDGSAKLIDAGQQRGGKSIRYKVADARDLGPLADGSFDAAALLMAVQDLDDVPAVFREMGRALRPLGRAVVIMMHPCFRVPRQSSWGWDEDRKIQYRRMDAYATAMSIPIATHPGSDPDQHTTFFHRPLSVYLTALGNAGLAVTACEELLTHRLSEPGGRSRGENRSKQEFPLFLAIKAVKLETKG